MDSARDFADRHFGVLLTASTTLAVVGKILFASDFQTPTALAIVSATTPTTLLLGLAVALTPSALAGALGVLGVNIAVRWAARHPFQQWIPGLALVLFLLAVTAAWVTLIALLLLIALLATLEALALRQSIDNGTALGGPATRATRLILTTMVPIFLATSILTPAPWPLERITLQDGPPITGYVLSTGDQWWAVLTSEARTVSYLPQSEIADRTICQLTPDEWWTTTIPELLNPREIAICEP